VVLKPSWNFLTFLFLKKAWQHGLDQVSQWGNNIGANYSYCYSLIPKYWKKTFMQI
jgi:hypothetical protein